VKKPKLGNGLKNFSQLEALQAIIRTPVYILYHPKNPQKHWQISFFTASVGRAGFLSGLPSPGHEKSAFPFDIQMQSDRLNLKAEDKIPASELKDTYEKQETQHIETGNSK
jgi:hypothetical protein